MLGYLIVLFLDFNLYQHGFSIASTKMYATFFILII